MFSNSVLAIRNSSNNNLVTGGTHLFQNCSSVPLHPFCEIEIIFKSLFIAVINTDITVNYIFVRSYKLLNVVEKLTFMQPCAPLETITRITNVKIFF